MSHSRVVSLRLRVWLSYVGARSRLIERITRVVRVLTWVVGIRHGADRLVRMLLLPGLLEILRRIGHRLYVSRILRLLFQRTRKRCSVASHTSIPREWGWHTARRND